MSVLVVGSVALDTIKTPFGKKRDVLGGSATYFSASAVFFSPVNLVAVVGADFPKRYLDFFHDKDIDTTGLQLEPGKTFRWSGEYGWDFSDPRTIATHLNVFAQFNPRIPPSYRRSKYVFLANIDPRLQMSVLGQTAKPRIIACDTMNYWIEQRKKDLLKLLKRVDIFLVNESEARSLTQESNLIRAGKRALTFGPGVVIIKKGEHGALLFSRRQVFAAPAFLLESIVDPTGAGDTFAGGLLGYLARCRRYTQTSLRRAIVYGSVMATFAVEDFSLGRLGAVTAKDITKRINQYRRYTSF
jgi:sugar/nucleoside kinase (ribokinase family)